MNMKKRLSAFGTILKRTAKGWNEDDPFAQSAVVAYYAIFSLPALLVLVINAIGLFVDKDTISEEISRQVESAMGSDTAKTVSDIVDKAGQTKAGIVASIIAVITIIFGATGVFVQLQRMLNQVWDVKAEPKAGWKKMLKDRVFSFGLVLSIGFLLLVSFAVSTALAAFSHWLEGRFPDAVAYLIYALDLIVSLGVIGVLFALMFKFLPDIRIGWKNIWLGAFLTAALFIAGKYGLSIYFGKAAPASVYGAAGSIVLVLLWVSYSSMIVFFGAEFTKQHALYHGVKIVPKKGAMKIENTEGQKKTLAEQGTNGPEKEQPMMSTNKKIVYRLHADDDEEDLQGPVTDINKKNKNDPEDKFREAELFKIKDRQGLHDEMQRLEDILAEDKEGIKDNLKLAHLLESIIPAALRIRHEKKLAEEKEKKFSWDSYLHEIAHTHITRPGKKETLFEKLKKRNLLFGKLRKFIKRNRSNRFK
jgi:membrane protein